MAEIIQTRSRSYLRFMHLGISLVFCLALNVLSGQGFVDVTQLDGMTITHDGEDPSIVGGDIGSGAAWIDFNNDGYLDLYITMRVGANLLFENLGPNGSGVIEWNEVASAAGVQDASNDGSGVVVGDFNNDGYDDMYLANVSEDVLYRNNGDGTFTDITSGSGLTGTGDSRGNSASWGDYDNDGYLDLFVSHHTPYPGASNATRQDFLFHNDGGTGSFTNVSGLLDISTNMMGLGFIAGWLDYDNDGDQDIILVNDCEEGTGIPEDGTHTRIFRNDSHLSFHWALWEFEEVSASIGVDDCRNGMGIAIGDLDRNGWLDFAYTNIGACILFQNDGDGTFTDISGSAGIGGQNVNHYSWGTAFFDYDLDGWQDLYFVLGSLWYSGATEPKPNELYRNNGDNTFTDMAASLNMDDAEKSRSGIIGDYDNDGDVDVFLMNYGEQCVLKENTNSNGNNWLQLKLAGTDSNADGLGARIKLTDSDGVVQYYEIKSGSNLGGGDDLRAYFGLGSATSITELKINWPSGNIQYVNPLPAVNQIVDVVEENSGPLPVVLEWFDARKESTNVILDWGTSSETGSRYFTVQKSADGRSFEDIGELEAHGTTTELSSYRFVDHNPNTGNNYYRLQQTDWDGTKSLSEIRLVRFENQKPTISIQPNPVTGGQIKLVYQGPDEEISVELFDMVGKLVYKGTLEGIDTIGELQINTTDLNNGLYFVNINGRAGGETLKLVINQ